MIRFYVIGLAILLVAITANAIVIKLGIKSWYEFIESFTNLGTFAFNKILIIDYIWLFIGYPFVLAFGYWIGDKLYQTLF